MCESFYSQVKYALCSKLSKVYTKIRKYVFSFYFPLSLEVLQISLCVWIKRNPSTHNIVTFFIEMRAFLNWYHIFAINWARKLKTISILQTAWRISRLKLNYWTKTLSFKAGKKRKDVSFVEIKLERQGQRKAVWSEVHWRRAKADYLMTAKT